MKLKNVLIYIFLIVTLIPIIVIGILIYNSGYTLAKESYKQNLAESINVQSNYISQTLENNMISDYRFANKLYDLLKNDELSEADKTSSLFTLYQSYLESSEDAIAVSLFIDETNTPLHTIGEKAVLENITEFLSTFPLIEKQKIIEFEIKEGVYSLGIITPVYNIQGIYQGSLISIYNTSHILKIISSYYEISNTSTYIFRGNGKIINAKKLSDENVEITLENTFKEELLTSSKVIETTIGNSKNIGVYNRIANTPWYLVGFVDYSQIYAFIFKYIWINLIIILLIFIVDIILSIYLSKKVVAPINSLIKLIEGYPQSLSNIDLVDSKDSPGYVETNFLKSKFISQMNAIRLVQHNFEGVYQLYQSNDMDDTNIDIDVKNQTIQSNKDAFKKLINEIKVREGACIVERFTNCFCEKDQILLMKLFETMRDQHLSGAKEVDIYTPYLKNKWFHTLIVPMYEDERLCRLFIQLRDISNFKEKELESKEIAIRDHLTKLYNRLGFIAIINDIIEKQEKDANHGLLFLDMNSFKLVNDNFGHSAGDDLLCTVSQIILSNIKNTHIASRFGGDEFAVFLPNTTEEELLLTKANLENALVFPFSTKDVSFEVTVSIGAALEQNMNISSFDSLIKEADEHMYNAKRIYKEHKIRV